MGYMTKESTAEAALENCRALIDRINAALSAEKPFDSVSAVTEFLSHLEDAASALKRSVQTTLD
jgi:hypothetical protein